MTNITMAQLQNFFKAGPGRTPRIKCEDGVSFSAQVGAGMYSVPRDNFGPYYKAEIGFPSEKIEEFMPFIESDEKADPTDTVYGYVPIPIIVAVINSHGGSKQIQEV